MIEAIHLEKGVTVKTDTGQRLTLALDSIAARSLDHAYAYAYASTVHDFQGNTVNRILIRHSSTATTERGDEPASRIRTGPGAHHRPSSPGAPSPNSRPSPTGKSKRPSMGRPADRDHPPARPTTPPH